MVCSFLWYSVHHLFHLFVFWICGWWHMMMKDSYWLWWCMMHKDQWQPLCGKGHPMKQNKIITKSYEYEYCTVWILSIRIQRRRKQYYFLNPSTLSCCCSSSCWCLEASKHNNMSEGTSTSEEKGYVRTAAHNYSK